MLKSIRNTVANFIGGLTALALILVFNALYFRISTDEVFSVISLLLTAQLIAPALDFGTGRTAGRILAEEPALKRDPAGLRDAVVTLQATNLAIALAIGAALALAAPAVAGGWLTLFRSARDQVSGHVDILVRRIRIYSIGTISMQAIAKLSVAS